MRWIYTNTCSKRTIQHGNAYANECFYVPQHHWLFIIKQARVNARASGKSILCKYIPAEWKCHTKSTQCLQCVSQISPLNVDHEPKMIETHIWMDRCFILLLLLFSLFYLFCFEHGKMSRDDTKMLLRILSGICVFG